MNSKQYYVYEHQKHIKNWTKLELHITKTESL